MVLDSSLIRQTYVEDCEVCCHPIEVLYMIEEDTLCVFERVLRSSRYRNPGSFHAAPFTRRRFSAIPQARGASPSSDWWFPPTPGHFLLAKYPSMYPFKSLSNSPSP